MKERMTPEQMATRVGLELQDGFYVNLGIGMPMLVAHHIKKDRTVMFQAENGVLGVGHHAEGDEVDDDLCNAGGEDITVIPGACYFDSALSFDMIRGGHLDATVLGAFQVSQKGDIANWKLPTRKVGSMGGAMDLAVGAKKTIALLKHTTKSDEPRVLKKCTYPLTAKECVKMIVTDLAVIDVLPKGLVLREIATGWTKDEVQKLTQAKLNMDDVKEWSV